MSTVELQPSTPVAALPGIGPRTAEAMGHLGLRTAGDLLRHFPIRYEHDRGERTVADLVAMAEHGESPVAAIRVEVASVRHAPRPRPRTEATFEDGTGTVRAVWFNAPWMRGKLHPGMAGVLQGQVKLRGRYLELANPKWEAASTDGPTPARTERLRPVYPASEDLSSATIERAVQSVLEPLVRGVADPLPAEFRASRALPPLGECYRRMHAPADMDEQAEARRRLAFEELLLLQLGVMMKKEQMRTEARAPRLPVTEAVDARIRARFPWPLTGEQDRACAEIAADLAQPQPMNRLLQGDVGSGKTAVALYGMLAAVAAGMQAALVAPTEILAEQHHASIARFLAGSDVRAELVTGSLTASARRDALARLASGESHIAIGTHALLMEGAVFRRLALAVIDEQHRFGVEQRAAMRAKAGAGGEVPHVLVMTATPIPRTLSLTVFGDLDVSVIRSRPAGRQPVATRVVGRDREAEVYAYLRTRVDAGEQCFVVVPAVEESASGLKDAEGTARALAAGPFVGLRLGVVHGQMPRDRREEAMESFRAGRLDVLVATTVIEVGVDVPNASLMVVEHADRFGLAQLHQLRGRVGRGTRRSLCVFVGDPVTEDGRRRLEAIASTDDGFEIAELDLAIRGPGELFGARQSGLPPFAVADLARDQELLRLARRDARAWIERDPTLADPAHQALRRKLMRTYGGALGLGDVA
jgi:ATP-dependent DNA helicase RecG